MPGLIDSHTLVTSQSADYYEDMFRKSPIDGQVVSTESEARPVSHQSSVFSPQSAPEQPSLAPGPWRAGGRSSGD